MSNVILKIHAGKFVMMPNETVQDESLSVEALGVLTRLCSYGEGYKFHAQALQKRWGIGRDKLRGIFRELRDKGYFKLIARRSDDNRRFDGQEWHLSTVPQCDWISDTLRNCHSTDTSDNIKEKEEYKNKTEKKDKEEASPQGANLRQQTTQTSLESDAILDKKVLLTDEEAEQHSTQATETESPLTDPPETTQDKSEKLFKRTKRGERAKKMSDSEFLAHLEETFDHVADVRFELKKAQLWCSTRGRQCTRAFFESWLGRIKRDESQAVLTQETLGDATQASESTIIQDGELLRLGADGNYYNRDGRVVVTESEGVRERVIRKLKVQGKLEEARRLEARA